MQLKVPGYDYEATICNMAQIFVKFSELLRVSQQLTIFTITIAMRIFKQNG